MFLGIYSCTRVVQHIRTYNKLVYYYKHAGNHEALPDRLKLSQ